MMPLPLNDIVRAGTRQDLVERTAHTYRQMVALRSHLRMQGAAPALLRRLDDITARARVTALEMHEWFSSGGGATAWHDDIIRMYRAGCSVSTMRSALPDWVSEYEVRQIINLYGQPAADEE